MAVYMVSYDLSKPKRNYEKLEAFLRSSLDWAHVLESVWFVQSPLTAYALAQKIRECVDSDDHFVVTPVVTPVGRHSVWYNLDPAVHEWLMRRSAA